jgi:AraC-like DNA-binding protein
MNPAEIVHYWHDPAFPRLEANQMLSSRHVFPRHVHEGLYAIGLMDEGGSYCLGEGKAFAAPGEVCLLNPGQVHAGGAVPNRRASYRMLFFGQTFLQEMVEEVSEGRRTELECDRVVVRDPALRDVLEQLLDGLVRGEWRLALEGALLEVVAHLLPYDGRPASSQLPAGRERRTVRLAREMLSEELEEKLSLAQVARTVGLSRYHFLRVFKKETGLTPHAYRTAQRLETAKSLLRGGMSPVEVALTTGFSDQSHFANAFRRFCGATPGQYQAGSRL